MVDFLSWHNSEVRCVIPPATPGGQARVVLSAGAVTRQSEGEAFQSSVAGFIKPLELVFEQATLMGPMDDCVGGMAQGELRLATSMRAHPVTQIPLPWHCAEPLTLSLQFRNGSLLLIEAASAHCTPADDASFIESYAC